MNGKLEFIDILREKEKKYNRQHDFNAFEFTYKAEITTIHKLTQMENLYRVRIIDPEQGKQFSFQPGQFVMLELPGIGEAPFSISSSPLRHGDIELCIRKAGNLTNFLSRVERGTRVGLRGPFGTGFPMEKMEGQNILLIAGGLGLAPLRSAIAYVQANRSRFNTVDIIYGTKDPSQLLFAYQYDVWRADDITLSIIVEEPDTAWKGPAGLITKILEDLFRKKDKTFFKNTYAIVCGPPVMFKFVCTMLSQKDIPMQKMFVSLERRMHCGMGKCCRCNVGSTYTCLKGPVFDYWTVMNLKEAI
ncbi:MAG: oxidoreductase [Nitrospira bacterium HGW-Nitrospira-1]|nr:MAG: oxidoreductase [Nitrospira bacterium HGW-Nitrospira-1]